MPIACLCVLLAQCRFMSLLWFKALARYEFAMRVDEVTQCFGCKLQRCTSWHCLGVAKDSASSLRR
eukprot:1269008-Pleurochrysis_carterae.AAC.2